MTLPKLFIQHIPKTGTTSVLGALRTIYGDDDVKRMLIPNKSQWNIYIRDPQSEWHTNKVPFVNFTRRWIDDNFDMLDRIPILHGHHPYQIIWPLVRETGRKLITFVREPISLAISWFSWDKARADMGLRTPLAMEHYLEEEIRNNILCKMLGRDEDYEFIGFNEWLEQDWAYLCYKLDFPYTKLLYSNTQPRGYNSGIVSNPALLQEIKRANLEDVRKYHDLLNEWRF